MDYIKIQQGACCVKFIARMGWFVVGSDDGFICVYNYKNKMQQITSFKVDGQDRVVRSLAIHPTQSYVLSTCSTGIQLWDWNGWFGWKCMQIFKEHSGLVRTVAFNPEDHNSFASGSSDGTINVLLSLFFL
jgi:WD40 repeat protein